MLVHNVAETLDVVVGTVAFQVPRSPASRDAGAFSASTAALLHATYAQCDPCRTLVSSSHGATKMAHHYLSFSCFPQPPRIDSHVETAKGAKSILNSRTPANYPSIGHCLLMRRGTYTCHSDWARVCCRSRGPAHTDVDAGTGHENGPACFNSSLDFLLLPLMCQPVNAVLRQAVRDFACSDLTEPANALSS